MTLKRIKYKGTKKSLPNIHCDEVDLIKKWNREITLRKLLYTEINVVPLNYKIRNNAKKEMIY